MTTVDTLRKYFANVVHNTWDIRELTMATANLLDAEKETEKEEAVKEALELQKAKVLELVEMHIRKNTPNREAFRRRVQGL